MPKTSVSNDIYRLFCPNRKLEELRDVGLLRVLRSYTADWMPEGRWLAVFDSVQAASRAISFVMGAHIGLLRIDASLVSVVALDAYRAVNSLMHDPEACVLLTGMDRGIGVDRVAEIVGASGFRLAKRREGLVPVQTCLGGAHCLMQFVSPEEAMRAVYALQGKDICKELDVISPTNLLTDIDENGSMGLDRLSLMSVSLSLHPMA